MIAERLNELRDRAHAMAKEKGWHETEHSDEHWLMLVITEVAEAVEAYRDPTDSYHRDSNPFAPWFENPSWRRCPQCGCDPVMMRDGSERYTCCADLHEIGGKPCGVGSELADVVIRMLDLSGLRRVEFQFYHLASARLGIDMTPDSTFVERMARLSLATLDPVGATFREIIVGVDVICEHYGIDLWAEVEIKTAFNATRARRHGNKLA